MGMAADAAGLLLVLLVAVDAVTTVLHPTTRGHVDHGCGGVDGGAGGRPGGAASRPADLGRPLAVAAVFGMWTVLMWSGWAGVPPRPRRPRLQQLVPTGRTRHRAVRERQVVLGGASYPQDLQQQVVAVDEDPQRLPFLFHLCAQDPASSLHTLTRARPLGVLRGALPVLPRRARPAPPVFADAHPPGASETPRSRRPSLSAPHTAPEMGASADAVGGVIRGAIE